LCYLFFLHAPTTTDIYSLSLHDALPISSNASLPFWKICTSSQLATGFNTFLMPNTVMGSSSTIKILPTLFIKIYVEGTAFVHFTVNCYTSAHGLYLVFDDI